MQHVQSQEVPSQQESDSCVSFKSQESSEFSTYEVVQQLALDIMVDDS